MELPPQAVAHLSDRVAWLTTVTPTNAPAPTPVWFVADEDKIVVFCEPISRRVRNLAVHPIATLHFNSDPEGNDVVVIRCTAELTDGSMAAQPGYLDKYPEAEEYVSTSTTKLVLTPVSVWLNNG